MDSERFWYWILFSERPRNQRCRGCCLLCRHYAECCSRSEVERAVLADAVLQLRCDEDSLELRDEPAIPA